MKKTMKNPIHIKSKAGFTLMETVIAIGVLAVLLTAFIAVFAPAAKGIRKAISTQEADRLTHTLKEELTTLRGPEATEFSTGFDKAFNWIKDAGNEPLILFQYRGDAAANPRADGTLEPYTQPGGVAGQDYVVQSIVRPLGKFAEWKGDLDALEGGVYAVVATQGVYKNGVLEFDEDENKGVIKDPHPDDAAANPPIDDPKNYPEAVIAFKAEFHVLKSTAPSFIKDLKANGLKSPVFSRNLAVRR